jgi:hypothetical protein
MAKRLTANTVAEERPKGASRRMAAGSEIATILRGSLRSRLRMRFVD